MEIDVPAELEEELKRVVDEKYKGDLRKVVIHLIENFIKEESQKKPKTEHFGSALSKVQNRQSHKDDILDSEMDAAFRRMKERKDKFDKF